MLIVESAGIILKSVDSERSLHLASVSLSKRVEPARAAISRVEQSVDNRDLKIILS